METQNSNSGGRRRSKPTENDGTAAMDMGRVPPQALDLEEAVLGAAMVEKDLVMEVLDILQPESFYKDAHQLIFIAIRALSARAEPIDLMTVCEELKRTKQLKAVGGRPYLAQLTLKVGSGANIDFHAKIIAQKFLLRELIRISNAVQREAFDDSTDVEDLLNKAQEDILKLAENNIKREAQQVGDAAGKVFEDILKASENKEILSGLPSGFNQLDEMTQGWQKSDLIIVAARPSMGKTAFALSMARNMVFGVGAKEPIPVAFFSLEMSTEQLVTRLFMSESEISGKKLRSGKMDEGDMKKLSKSIEPLLKSPLYIDDTPGLNIFEFRTKIRRLHKKHNIRCAIIDYLQLMTGPPENKGFREQEVSAISRALKGIAKDLGIPIIALSQLNRAVEGRMGNSKESMSHKRPQLSDLRESGAIEQDADIVAFVHRPEYYGLLTYDDEQQTSTEGMADIIVAKHRNGATGDVRLRFRKEFTRFENIGEENLNEVIGAELHQTIASSMNSDIHPNTGFEYGGTNETDTAVF